MLFPTKATALPRIKALFVIRLISIINENYKPLRSVVPEENMLTTSGFYFPNPKNFRSDCQKPGFCGGGGGGGVNGTAGSVLPIFDGRGSSNPEDGGV